MTVIYQFFLDLALPILYNNRACLKHARIFMRKIIQKAADSRMQNMRT